MKFFLYLSALCFAISAKASDDTTTLTLSGQLAQGMKIEKIYASYLNICTVGSDHNYDNDPRRYGKVVQKGSDYVAQIAFPVMIGLFHWDCAPQVNFVRLVISYDNQQGAKEQTSIEFYPYAIDPVNVFNVTASCGHFYGGSFGCSLPTAESAQIAVRQNNYIQKFNFEVK